MNEMIKKFHDHDWYYEYLEDGGQWSAACKKHRELMAEVRKMPMNQVYELIEHVPSEVRETFLADIGRPACTGS